MGAGWSINSPNIVPLKKNIVLLVLWLDKVLGPESNKKYLWSKLHIFRRKQGTRMGFRPHNISIGGIRETRKI